ncbi:efflux RND transporter permease subunit [Amphritea sp. HPY]|uniref:efflux RND transporter permease subunit n=1 Tax=Amphritea sp. HPY TaxID=3421652 RepID=UPI003D7DE973
MMNTNTAHYTRPLVVKAIFNIRRIWLLLFTLITLLLGWQASKIQLAASFESMIPHQHPFIQKYFEHKADLESGNVIRIVVEQAEGDIFDANYLKVVQQVNDSVFFLPGVDRSSLLSVWSPAARWNEVTAEGFDGGQLIPSTYNGSSASLDQLRKNIERSSYVGSLIANDFRSTMVYVPLIERNPQTGETLDYQAFSDQLEVEIRDKFQTAKVRIHISGFAKKVGDLLDGIVQILFFSLGTLTITAVLLFIYSRCLRSTLAPLLCSVVAVIWQLGLLSTLGFKLDAYSVLVPFLVFAIAVSHGVQIINGVAHESAYGKNKLRCAEETFLHIYKPGMIALLSDGIGFATLMIIQITVIQELAIAASMGIAVIILTNLILLPILMSYLGVSKDCIEHAQYKKTANSALWNSLARFSQATPAKSALLITCGLVLLGVWGSQGLHIGDIEKGAPELRPDSRYNQDVGYLNNHYSASSDLLTVMVETADNQCNTYPVMTAMERFQLHMRNVPGVQSVESMVDTAKLAITGVNEGNPKWFSLQRNKDALNNAVAEVPPGWMNAKCNLVSIFISLEDHKAETLKQVIHSIRQWSESNPGDNFNLQLAAGNAGIEAATNEVIEVAQYEMLAYVYGVVCLLCLIMFRSLKAVLCVVLPLTLTTLLCQALMAWLGIGVKVATLPVIALGVGIGVDYGIYIYSRLQSYLDLGHSLSDSFRETLLTTGKAVSFTGITLALGVATWILSPIQFQADMGILLTFMFLWNMLGALILIPALTWLLHKNSQQASLASQFSS